MTSVEFHVGGSVVKENKVRFAYFSVKAEAKIVKENVQDVDAIMSLYL